MFFKIFRYFLTSLTGVDVPVLYSPIPFENAALTAPEVGLKLLHNLVSSFILFDSWAQAITFRVVCMEIRSYMIIR